MTADDISTLVRDQIAGRNSLQNLHGVELNRSLATPSLITVVEHSIADGKPVESLEQVWLVLEAHPTERDGYMIVFNPQLRMFGLATCSTPAGEHPVLCGWYGTFLETLAAM